MLRAVSRRFWAFNFTIRVEALIPVAHEVTLGVTIPFPVPDREMVGEGAAYRHRQKQPTQTPFAGNPLARASSKVGAIVSMSRLSD